MIPDLNWLVEIIKSGVKTTVGITVGCALILFADHLGWPQPMPHWMIPIATFGFLLFGALSAVTILSSAPIQEWIKHWLTIHREKRAVRDYIPHMTEKEREIISYLLAKNQKGFMYTIDGGYAVTLISRGIIVCDLKSGQAGSRFHIPFSIPDHIWSVLLQHKREFPYNSPPPGKTEVYPWSINFMVR